MILSLQSESFILGLMEVKAANLQGGSGGLVYSIMGS